jgi:drug/metabolite transporter (DMT)-like permease
MFLLVKLMSSTNTFTLVFYRSLVQIAISLATLIWEGKNPLGPPGNNTRLFLFLRGMFGATAVCAWFFGIQVLPLPDAVTLQFTTPPFAAAFAVCIVGEKWMPLDIVGAMVCLTGVALIAHPTWLFGKSQQVDQDDQDDTAMLMKALAVAVTTGGAAFAGIAYVLVRKIGERASAVVMVFYYGAVSVPIVFLGSGLLEGRWNVWAAGETNFSVHDYFLLLLMGIAGYCGQWFINLGLQNETAATVSDS